MKCPKCGSESTRLDENALLCYDCGDVTQVFKQTKITDCKETEVV